MVHTHALVNGFIFHFTQGSVLLVLTHSDARSIANTDQDGTF